MAGCDVVGSTLGATSAYRAPTTLYSEGIRNIIQAMHGAGVRRLIAVTAAPLIHDKDDTLLNRVMNRMMWAFIKELYSDVGRMESVIRSSGLDWTVLRPPRLTNKPRTGHLGHLEFRHVTLQVFSNPDVRVTAHIPDTQTGAKLQRFRTTEESAS